MKLVTKKLIAREGLVALGILLISFVMDFENYPHDIFIHRIFFCLALPYILFRATIYVLNKYQIKYGKLDVCGLISVSLAVSISLLDMNQAVDYYNKISYGVVVFIGVIVLPSCVIYLFFLIYRFVRWALKTLME